MSLSVNELHRLCQMLTLT